MILASYGEEYSEDELSKLLKSRDFGTHAPNVRFLERIGYRVHFGSSDLETVQRELALGHRVIAFVLADFLAWAKFSGLHAVVVVEQIFETEMTIHDPAEDHGPQTVSREEFLLAWGEFDNSAAFIWRAEV
jgi:ABC-type bacteriocin/lantibiotic exporter with double-glycine peptidase domain